jgi:hypothetical protein
MWMVTLAGLVVLFPAYSQAVTPCKQSGNLAKQVCLKEVIADFKVAVANCLHSSTTQADLRDCKQEPREERVDGIEECGDIREAYKEACDMLQETAYDPVIDPNNFDSVVDHPFFALDPNKTYVYEGNTADGLERVEVSLTGNTVEILGVTCTEVYDVEFLDGVMIEETWDWFAQDLAGSVWYFGELSFELEDGEIVSMDGSWAAGRDGAKPGIIMPAVPVVGDVYRQEFLFGEAEDMGEVMDLSGSETVPHGGTYTNLLVIRDFTPLEPDEDERKYYADGIGLILEVDLETGDRIELIAIN